MRHPLSAVRRVPWWSPIAFELRFEDGFEEAREWLYTAATRDELGRTCREARSSKHKAAITVTRHLHTSKSDQVARYSDGGVSEPS